MMCQPQRWLVILFTEIGGLEDIEMATASNSRVLRTVPLLLIVALFCPFTYSKVIYVDDDATGANNGTSWIDAYTFLQEALADANSAEKPVGIRVAQGVYRPDQGLAAIPEFDWRTATFQLINGVTIKGGYAGFGETDPDARNTWLRQTILSGDLTGDDAGHMDDPSRSENCLHVVTGSWTDATAVLDGFTITAGNANRFGNPDDSGGGMYSTSGSPTIINCTFRENAAVYAGGVANRVDCSPKLINCTFIGNSVHSSGAGIYDWHSASTLVNCSFSGNFGRGGAAMRVYHGESALTNCSFSGNFARERGGALYVNLGNVTLTNCTLADNSAGAFHGGGIYNRDESSTVHLFNCILWNNSDSGGISESAQIHGGTPVVNYCCIQGWTGTWGGLGNMGADPMFVRDPDDGGDGWGLGNKPEFGALLSIAGNDDFGDLHLRSQAGRWDKDSESWIQDEITSPCIDAGDPNRPIAFEPFPNGGIINMGTYGGTAEASKSPSGVHAKYGGGTGEPNDPYLIYTAEHLNEIGPPEKYEKRGDRHFKLMANIDLDPNLPGGQVFEQAVIPEFSDTFNGNDFVILNLTIVAMGDSSIGLFGVLEQSAQIRNLGVVDANVVGAESSIWPSTGILVGLTTQSQCSVINCYSTGSVSGNAQVGGLVGHNNFHATVSESYSTASVTGDSSVGGLVGWNRGDVTNCYSRGPVSGGYDVGGLVGENYIGATVSECFSTGSVAADGRVGGLVGFNRYRQGRAGRVINSFWDVETSDQSWSDGGTGLTTTQMQLAGNFLSAGWDFVGETTNGIEDVWWILEGQDYPRLWWELGDGASP
jgi:predicted outer membrane repeat protein